MHGDVEDGAPALLVVDPPGAQCWWQMHRVAEPDCQRPAYGSLAEQPPEFTMGGGVA